MILEKSQNPAIMADQIQQLAGMIKGADEASEIDYDNTESGLTAENVQAALDELAGITAVQSEASGIEYDNTESGLTADDVQGALDEIAASTTSGETETITPEEGYTIVLNNIKKLGKQISGVIGVNGTYTTNTWVNVATVTDKPNGDVYFPVLNISSGVFAGMAEITSNGVVRVFLTVSSAGAVFTILYWTV